MKTGRNRNLSFSRFFIEISYAPTHFGLSLLVHRRLKVRRMLENPKHLLRAESGEIVCFLSSRSSRALAPPGCTACVHPGGDDATLIR